MLESDLDRKKKSPQCGCNHTEGGNFQGTEFKRSSSPKDFNLYHLPILAGGLSCSLLQALAETAVFALLAILFASTRSM